MPSATKQFIMTDIGAATVAAATPHGPFVDIETFKLGDDATTDASNTDTGLVGTTVYTGTPISFSYYDAQTVQINMEVPSDVGPFDYGEIGLFLPGDVLFARFSYGVLHTKQTSLSSGFANVLRIKALIRVSQGPAIFNLPAPSDDQQVLEVATFALVNTPAEHPENPLVIVHEANDYQESYQLFKNENTLWDIANASCFGTATIDSAADSTHMASTFFTKLSMAAMGDLGKYVIQTEGGYLRMVKSVASGIIELTSALATASVVGHNVKVYILNSAQAKELQGAAGVVNFPNGISVGSGGLVTGDSTGKVFLNDTVAVIANLGIIPKLPSVSYCGAVGYSWADGFYDFLHVAGAITWGSYTIAYPDGSKYGLLRKDGTWATGIPGHIILSANNIAEANTIPADGTDVSRTTYALLWVAMGSPNTGNGTTTFTLPDATALESAGIHARIIYN